METSTSGTGGSSSNSTKVVVAVVIIVSLLLVAVVGLVSYRFSRSIKASTPTPTLTVLMDAEAGKQPPGGIAKPSAATTTSITIKPQTGTMVTSYETSNPLVYEPPSLPGDKL
jgi:hypothetical protein